MSWNKYDSGENGAEETPDSEERSEVFGAQVHSETEVSGGYQEVTVCVPAEMPPVVPVTGESFCQCPAQTELNSHINPNICTCGEEEQGCDWVWDMESKSPGTTLSCSDRMVSFHSDYSCGTAAVRGSQAINDGQHFWEIKMTSPVYGTDMMVGVGTPEVNLDQFRHSFCSMLGTDEDSWGLSYTGQLHHKGSKLNFSSRFGQGSIIGLHLDTWHGTLSFYKNRRCIGVAATHLQNKRLYPMVCSTAAKSSMKLIRSRSTPTTLQYLCCTQLRCMLPDCADARRMMSLPPGLCMLLSNRLGWVLSLGCSDGNDKVDCVEQDTSPVPIHIPTGPDHDFISSSVSDNPGSYNSKEIYQDSTSLDEGSYPDSASLMDVSCHFCPSSPSDPSFMSDHTPLSDPTHHPVPPVCPSTSLPAHTMFLPDSNSDSDSDEFCSDSETYQRKRCRWT